MPDDSLGLLRVVWAAIGLWVGLVLGHGVFLAEHEERRSRQPSRRTDLSTPSRDGWPTRDQKTRDFEHALAHLLAASAGYIVFLATLVSVGFEYSGATTHDISLTTKRALAVLLSTSLVLCVYFLLRICQLAHIVLPTLSGSYRDHQRPTGGDFGVLWLGAVLATFLTGIDFYILFWE
jgi:hypothetical protein